MKRLIKKAVMTQEMFESNLQQLSEKGRTILRSIEEYKFTLEQAARVFTNDQQLSQKLIQKRKTMDAAAGQIYSVVFDVENIDIVNSYENMVQQSLSPSSGPPMGGPARPPQAPTQVPQAPQTQTTPPQGGGGGGAPTGGSGGGEPSGGEENEEGNEEEPEAEVPEL